jgi:hypothetical protein
MKKVISFYLTGFIFIVSANACDLCSIYHATEAESATPGLFVGMFSQFTHFGTLQYEGHEIPNETDQYVDSYTTQTLIGYLLNKSFSIQANVPYHYRSFRRPEGFATDKGTESGLGDVTLLGKYCAYENTDTERVFEWHILGGIKLPTGSSDRLLEEFNESETEGAPESGIHGHDLALGSGSFDGIVGTSFFWQWKRMVASGNAQYAIRTKGDHDYRYANDLTWFSGIGFFLLSSPESTLSLRCNMSGENKGKDTFRGTKAEDTSMNSIYLGPESIFTWHNRLSAVAGFDLPVFQDSSALQAVPDYKVRVAVTWRF